MNISVVTPVYNGAKYVERTIRSVLCQNIDNMEYIIVDDGSTDNSVSIINKYSDRINLVKKEHSGLAKSLNLAFKQASGEVVCWIDCDNLILPGVLKRATEEFEKKPDLSIVYGDSFNIDEEDNIITIRESIHFVYNISLYGYLTILNCPVFLNAQYLKKIGFSDESLKVSSDMDIYLSISKLGSVKYMNDFVGAYRIRKGGLHIAASDAMYADIVYIRKKYAPLGISDSKLKILHSFYKTLAYLKMIQEGSMWCRIWPISRIMRSSLKKKYEHWIRCIEEERPLP